MSFQDKILVVIDSASGAAVKEMDRLQRSTRDADKGVSALGKTMKGALVAGAAAFAGAGLVSFLNDSVTAYGEAAKRAGELAKTTGGSVQGVSRLTAALTDAGIGADESAGLLTKFTTSAGKQQQLLRSLGVELKRGAGGTIDYADGMVRAVDAINRIGDSSKRNQALVSLFGKKGASAFNELAASGVSLSDAMAAVSKHRVFDAADVARAVKYDDAMDRLGGSVQGLQFSLGEKLVPALSASADGLSTVVGVLSAVPTEVYAVVGGVAALKAATTFLGPPLARAVDDIALAMTGMGAAVEQAGGKAQLLGKGLVAAIGPWNLAMAAVAVGTMAISAATEHSNRQIDAMLPRMRELEKAGLDAGAAARQTAQEWESSAGWMDKFLMGMNTGHWWDWLAPNRWSSAVEGAFRDGGADADNFDSAIKKVKDDMGAYAADAAASALTQKNLNDLLSEGGYSAEEYAAAAGAAAQQQADANTVTEAAKVAMGEYAVSIQGVVDWQGRLADNAAAAQNSLGSLQDTLGKVGKIMDDPATWENEVVLNTAQAESDLWRYVGILANSGLTAEQIIPMLIELQNRDGTSAEADAVVQGVIDSITGKSNEVPPIDVRTALDPASAGTTQAGIDALSAPKTTTVNVTTTYGDGGYEGAKARSDYLAQNRTGSIDISHTFSPDGYNALKQRTDYLAQNRNGRIGIDVAFSPDGYSAIKARVDYLAQNRTATITQVVNRAAGAGSGGGGADKQSLGAGGAGGALFSPINMVNVRLDGRELRSVIDDEIRALSPRRQEVA